jgi:hypothetical protein
MKEELNAKVHLQDKQEFWTQYGFKGTSDIQVF